MASLMARTLLTRLSMHQKQRRGLTQRAKVFLYLVVLCFASLWVSASVAGASLDLSSSVAAFAGAAAVVTLASVGMTIGFQSLKADILHLPLVRKLSESRQSDWAKAFGVVVLWPVWLAYLAASVLNQRARVRLRARGWDGFLPEPRRLKSKRLHGSDDDDDESDEDSSSSSASDGDGDRDGGAARRDEAALWLTWVAHHQCAHMRRWRWTSVLVKVHWWAVAFYVFNVGVSKAVTVFLCHLNAVLTGVPIATTTAIFFATGLCMFLLPPARQRFTEHFHTLECGHRPAQALDSADQIPAPVY